MDNEIQNLINEYIKWLADKTSLRTIEEWAEITTPYLDRHNDYLQIYVKKENGKILITDDGYTINDLKQSGCKLETKKRKDLLKMTLNGFGVQLEGDSLITSSSPEKFALKKHNLIQAMLAVNDLFYLSVPLVTSLFLEDVTEWLELHEIRYVQNIKFTGASGYDHVFDFVIPKSRQKSERIVKAINRPSRDTAESFAWAWIDTKEVRPLESIAYAFLNDSDLSVPLDVIDALKSYEIIPMLWSEREGYREELLH